MSAMEEIESAVDRLVGGEYFRHTPNIGTVGQLIDKVVELAELEDVDDVMDEFHSLRDYGKVVRSMEIYDEQIDGKDASSYERIAELSNMVMDVVDQKSD